MKRRCRQFVGFLVVTLISFCQVTYCYASNVFQVGIIDVKPWGYLDKGQLSGIQIDIFSHLSEETGFSFEYKFLPLKRAQHYIKRGTIDLVMLFVRDEINTFVESVGKVHDYKYYLVGQPEKNLFLTKKSLTQIGSIGVKLGDET